MTITWRLSIFRKKKITFTKIAFEKFMKVLLHDILSSWYNTTVKYSWKVVSILFSNDLVLKIQYSKLSLAYLHAENIFFLIFFLSSDRTFGRLIQYDFLLEEDIALVMTTVFGRKQRYCFSDKQTFFSNNFFSSWFFLTICLWLHILLSFPSATVSAL